MKNLPLLIVTVLGTLALVVVVAVMFSNSSTSSSGVEPTVLLEGANNRMGPEQPVVTIVEFSDFQCPACKAVEPLVKQTALQYPDQVQVVYRHFPLLSIHPHAELAARASEVAAQEDLFWEMHDILFERQQTWSAANSSDAALALFTDYAEEIGLDRDLFTEAIQSDTVRTTVAQDMALGTQLGVNATPTLYVNGKKLTAPQQLPVVVAEIINQ